MGRLSNWTGRMMIPMLCMVSVCSLARTMSPLAFCVWLTNSEQISDVLGCGRIIGPSTGRSGRE